MIIRLPDGRRHKLDKHLSLEEKCEVVIRLIEDWNSEIHLNWESNSIKYFLNQLSDYLVWHKEDEDVGKEDKDVISERKNVEMIGKKRGMSTPFTNLSNSLKNKLFGEGGYAD